MKTPRIRLAIMAAACLAGAVHAQTRVAPPPLPIGSQMARPEPGMSEPERKRAVRAHHHKMHNKKDYTRDDSVPAAAAAVQPALTRPGAAAGMGSGAAGAAGAVQGGAGTGPGREKTDRGASSFFFGQDQKKDKK
ncbi:hypothetical protein [Ramlibacter sp. AN1133]|uniref:hypothetical protein n=1 Tax=Ramlibacter sp. AN1133 TaxID=3133429 RepID=UPI0030BC4F90